MRTLSLPDKLVRISALAIALAITVGGFLAFAHSSLPEPGSSEPARCFTSVWQAQWPKWLGCAMARHENLAGGLIGAAGALLAAYIAWLAVQDQLRVAREQKLLASSDVFTRIDDGLIAEAFLLHDLDALMGRAELDIVTAPNSGKTSVALGRELMNAGGEFAGWENRFKKQGIRAWSERSMILRRELSVCADRFSSVLIDIGADLASGVDRP